jgi:hypothetical protein
MARHEGWKNYETWCVALWINNDQGEYEFWKENARATAKIYRKKTVARRALADELKDRLTDARPEVDGVWSDLLSAALSEVDWDEVAADLLTD